MTLPQMLEGNLRMDKTIIGPGRKVTAVFTFINSPSSNYDSNLFSKNARQGLIKDGCKNDALQAVQIYLKEGVTFVFRYYGNDNIHIADVTVTPADCGY